MNNKRNKTKPMPVLTRELMAVSPHIARQARAAAKEIGITERQFADWALLLGVARQAAEKYGK